MLGAFLQSMRDSFTIIGVECVQKALKCHFCLFGKSKHLPATLRPDEFITGKIPLPRANVGALDRKLELFLLFS